MNDLDFRPMPTHARGTILQLLRESYRILRNLDQGLLGQWEADWAQYDEDIFDHPETVGASGFVTYCGETMVGFASWDPRQRPTLIVGHNCVLPAFRGQGYGTRQILEVLARATAHGFTKAEVTTGDHIAFVPAQRMYLACGFRETRRFAAGEDWKVVGFEKELSPRDNA